MIQVYSFVFYSLSECQVGVVIMQSYLLLKMDANSAASIVGANSNANQITKDASTAEEHLTKGPIHSIMKKTTASKSSSKTVKVDFVGGVAPTRTSQRQIKRPKMDDELIDFESSSRGSTSKKPKVISTTNNTTPKSLPSVCEALLQ